MLVAIWRISRVLSELYDERFDSLAQIIAEAMAERDAEFQLFRGKITKMLVTDTQIFDVLLDDPKDAPVALIPSEEVPDVVNTGEVSADAE